MQSQNNLSDIFRKNYNKSIKNGEIVYDKIENKEAVLYYILCSIINCHDCSYRYIIYDMFNFDISSYVILQYANLIELNNVDREDIYCNNDNYLFREGRKIFNQLIMEDKINLTAFIIENFTSKNIDKLQIDIYKYDIFEEFYQRYLKELENY